MHSGRDECLTALKSVSTELSLAQVIGGSEETYGSSCGRVSIVLAPQDSKVSVLHFRAVTHERCRAALFMAVSRMPADLKIEWDYADETAKAKLIDRLQALESVFRVLDSAEKTPTAEDVLSALILAEESVADLKSMSNPK